MLPICVSKVVLMKNHIFTFDLYLFYLCFTCVLHMIHIVHMFSTCVLHMIQIGLTRVLRMFSWWYAYVFAKKLRQIEFFVRTTCRPQGSPARKGTLWAVSKLRVNAFLFVCFFFICSRALLLSCSLRTLFFLNSLLLFWWSEPPGAVANWLAGELAGCVDVGKFPCCSSF